MFDTPFDRGGSPVLSAISAASEQWNARHTPPRPDCPRWRAISETGIFSLACSPERPFSERCLEIIQGMERLGELCEDGGFAFSVATHLASTLTALDRFASQELRDEVLADLVSGRSIGAHAISEAEAGSDALAMQTTATRDGEAYI